MIIYLDGDFSLMAKTKLSVEEKKELARKHIMDASIELFYEKGYNQTTTRDIIARAGILNGSLYNRFRNKDEILASLVKEAIKDILVAASKVFEKERNLLLAASFPGAMQIYLASKSPRIADLLYTVHTMWPAVENYVELNSEWSDRYLSEYGIQDFDEEGIRMCMISLIGSVGNQVGYYAHGGTTRFEDALRHHIFLIAATLGLPLINIGELIDKLRKILEDSELCFMGHRLAEEIPELSKGSGKSFN